jgi:hypothetical protein
MASPPLIETPLRASIVSSVKILWQRFPTGAERRRRDATKWRMMHSVSGRCCDHSGADCSATVSTTPGLLCVRVDQCEPDSQIRRTSDMRPRGHDG